MKRKQVLTIVVIFTAVLLAWLGCSKRPESPASQPIEFSAVLPLTGPLALLGANEMVGINQALEELKAKGHQRISFRFDDSQGKGPNTVSIIRKNWDISGSRFFIISTTTPLLATLPMLRDTTGDKVVIAQTMYPGVTIGYPFAHRLFPSSKQEAELLATHAAALGLSRVAILHVKNEWGLESAAVFRKTLEAKGGQIVATETYTFADKDFRPMLNKLVAASPQAILLYAYPDNFPTILTQLAELGQSLPILANTDFGIGNIADKVPAGLLAQTVFPAPRYFYDAQTDEIKAFNQRITAAGHQPNFDIATFYDMTMILNRAAELATDKSPGAFAEGLAKSLPYHGVTGDIRGSGERDVQVDFSLARWRNGKLEIIKP